MTTAKKDIKEIHFTQNSDPIRPTLYQHQQDVVDRGPMKRLLAFDTGTGKTITSISLVNKHFGTLESRVVDEATGTTLPMPYNMGKMLLVIVPKTNVVQWETELKKYVNYYTHCTILSKEQFKKQAKELRRYDAVIVDEGHYFAGLTSGLSKALHWYLNKHKIEIVYICTATPYCSTPFNIYTLARHLGYNWNYMDFRNKFFYFIPMGARQVPVMRKGMEDEVAKLVKEIGDTVDIKDVVDVPEQSVEKRDISLTREQIDAIATECADPVFIVRWTRRHQVENGFLYGDNFTETKTYPNQKIHSVCHLQSMHKKIVVVARYTEQLKVYEKRFAEYGVKTFLLSGETKNRQEIIDQANATDECVFLMQASCSAGFELPTFRVMVFASLSFSSVDHVQAKGRILRINNLKENKYVYLVADGVDRDVYDCIMRKQDFNIAIYAKDQTTGRI